MNTGTCESRYREGGGGCGGGWWGYFFYIWLEKNDFNITWQTCFLGDPLPRLFK